MPRMRNDTLKAILAAEKKDALSSQLSSRLSQEREDAMRYYLGDVSKDLPAADGRSRAVSMDVLDTVEGLMPSLMEIFSSSDKVVRFEPVAEGDEDAAEQETDYVNHVFMQKNLGFLVLYSFIKDALLSKVGVVKVLWDSHETEEHETYYDQPDDAFMMLVSDPSVDVIEHSMRDDPAYGKLHDVKIAKKVTYACAKVEPVPPEEFGIAKRARNVRDCGYCFHEVVRTEGELINDGYDKVDVRSLKSYASSQQLEETARDTVDEGDLTKGGDTLNKANRPIRITEHYVRLDYEGNGKSLLYRITTGGEETTIIARKDEDEVVEIDFIPMAAMTPVIMTHRFFGRSIADLVMDIQRIKTVLLRSLLDNAYLANNPRVEVAEDYATPNTLDDLLVSRPAGIVRMRQPGGLNVFKHPDIGGHVYPLLEYQDATREWRTGVTRQGQGIDANALQNQTATAANQLYNAAQARMRLIARIFAETGIKDMFQLLHATIRKEGTQPQTVRLKNKWVQVDPRNWKTRDDMTINVGLGSGGKTERLGQVNVMFQRQAELVAAGKSNIVSDKNIYNSAKELVKLIDLKTVEPYFTDPESEEGMRASQAMAQRPDPSMMEAQGKLQIEQAKAQGNLQIEQAKTQSVMQMDQAKLQSTVQIEAAKLEQEAAIKREQMVAEFSLRREQMTAEFALRREEMLIEAELKREANRMNAAVASEKAKSDGITDTRMGGDVG